MLGKAAPQALALGQLGSDFIEDTNAHTGSWGVLQCLTACTFTTLTSGNLPSVPAAVCMTGALAGISLSPGMEIRGLFTAITLASGKIIAYRI